MTTMPKVYLASLAVLLGACGGAGGGGNGADLAMADLGPSPDLTRGPDMSCTGTGTATAGSACTSASDCGGCKPTCSSTLGGALALPAPGGYCSGTCKKDADCGEGGMCETTTLHYCLATCTGKNQCGTVNSKNICGSLPTGDKVCLPVPFECNPTSATGCGGAGSCLRIQTGNFIAIDDAGTCLTPCTVGSACADDSAGNPQSCYFLNLRIDGQGTATGDAFAGLACILDDSSNVQSAPQGGKPNTACTFLNSCVSGYECDFYGGKLCKQLCENGVTDCGTATCKNAFKLDGFGDHDFGLCL